MSSYKWAVDTAKKRINSLIEQVSDVEILDYTRDMDFENIPTNRAYKLDAVHIYIDIMNLEDMLVSSKTSNETETAHKRALCFFDAHYRAVRYILDKTDSIFVDFHNQRLHAIVSKPYNSSTESKANERLTKAVAIANLIQMVTQERTNNADELIESAKLRIGIDSGISLAVNNGRHGNKEPLFLGNPANIAAKHSFGDKEGIYLTNTARRCLDLETVDDSKYIGLSKKQISDLVKSSKLDELINFDNVISELKTTDKKLSDFDFSKIEPPMKNLDFDKVFPSNTKNLETVSLYADIDGFTDYIGRHINDENGSEQIIQCLHVLRSELDNVLYKDFSGRKVRFIGDCLHGLICEGTKYSTDRQKTAEVSTECAFAMQSSFNMALGLLENANIDINGLGLAIGYEFGLISVSRMGKKGQTSRCALGTAGIESEKIQMSCNNAFEIKAGSLVRDNLSQELLALFDKNGSAVDKNYSDIDQVNSIAKSDNIDASSNEIFESPTYFRPHAN